MKNLKGGFEKEHNEKEYSKLIEATKEEIRVN